MQFVSFIHTDREGLYNPEMMVFPEERCFEGNIISNINISSHLSSGGCVNDILYTKNF